MQQSAIVENGAPVVERNLKRPGECDLWSERLRGTVWTALDVAARPTALDSPEQEMQRMMTLYQNPDMGANVTLQRALECPTLLPCLATC